jgi:hypothetical protein
MSRRTRQRAKPRDSADLGPNILHERGDVTVISAPDPDAPNRTIRRARRVWAPDVLLANGTIQQEHHAAATRLHDAYALGVLGARERLAIFIDRTGTPAAFGDAQLAAARDYREAAQAVGIVAMSALSWCVLSYGTVGGWAACRGWHQQRAQGYLIAALDRLAEHYG